MKDVNGRAIKEGDVVRFLIPFLGYWTAKIVLNGDRFFAVSIDGSGSDGFVDELNEKFHIVEG
jgi:hypothetical protein